MSNIGTIEVHNYRRKLGIESGNQHQQWKRYINAVLVEELRSARLQNIDVYNLTGDRNLFASGGNNRMVVFGYASNGSSSTATLVEQGLVINGIHTSITEALSPVEDENTVLIKSQEGLNLAVYHKRYNELYILFDLFADYTDARRSIFKYIIKEVERLVFYPKTLENSWVHTQDKEKLVERFTTRLKRRQQESIDDDRRRLVDNEQNIERYKREVKRMYDNVLRLRRQIEVEENNLGNVSDKLIKDVDLVSRYEKVKDVHIIDGVFHIWTEPIYCYSSKGERFYIGDCKFTINIENTDVRFFNLNNPRNGFWTSADPHPHVNGADGSACLGSIATTIAELCSMNEVYALTLTCIDFLENANVSDPAGAKVYNWDMVDELGEIVSEGGEDEEDFFICDCCDERTHIDDECGAYNDANPEDGAYNEVRVCDGCADDNYYYSDYYEVRIHCSINEPEEDK